MRKWLIILGVLLLVAILAVIVAVWRMPASLVLETAQSRLPAVEWAEAEGTAWKGRIEGFTWKGLQLGTIEWTFDGFEDFDSRLTRWNVHGFSPQYDVTALVTLTPEGEIRRVRDLRGQLPASWIDVTDKLPLLYLDGTLQLDMENLELDQYLPVNGSGTITWVRAAVTGGANERFGTLQMDLAPKDEATPEGMLFSLQSLEPADVRLAGRGSLLRNDYDIDLQLEIAQERDDLLQFMQQLGGETGPGRYRYSWQGNIR